MASEKKKCVAACQCRDTKADTMLKHEKMSGHQGRRNMEPKRLSTIGINGMKKCVPMLTSSLMLMLMMEGQYAYAEDQIVYSLEDSGTGSLREAVANVGFGEKVIFGWATSSETINLESDLDIDSKMQWSNDNIGRVTIDLGGNQINVNSADEVSFGNNITIQNSGTGKISCFGKVSQMKYDISNLACNVSATSINDVATAFAASGSMNIFNVSGDVTANGKDGGIGFYASDTIGLGPVSGTIDATAQNSDAFGVKANTLSCRGLSGKIQARCYNGDACGIFTNESCFVYGSFEGSVTAQATNGSAHGFFCRGDRLQLDGVAGSVSATALSTTGTHHAYGLYGMETFVCSLNGISGTISAETYSNGNAYAIHHETSSANNLYLIVKYNGKLAAISHGGGDAYAIYSGTSDDLVTLNSGCMLIGDISLGGGNDTLTLAGASRSTAYDGNISAVEKINTTGGTWILNGVISDNATINIGGSSIVTLAGDNTFDGGVTMSGGTLILGHDNALASTALSITNHATLQSNNDSRVVDNAITVSANKTLTVNGSYDLVLNGSITGDGGFKKSGIGTLILGATNEYTGGTVLSGGAVGVGSVKAFGKATTTTDSGVLAGGPVQVSEDTKIFAYGAARDLYNNFTLDEGKTLTVTNTSQILSGYDTSEDYNISFRQDISGSGKLKIDMTNDSRLFLRSENSYTGGTDVANGTVGISHDNSFGTGDINILDGGSLTIYPNITPVITMDNRIVLNSVNKLSTFMVAGNGITYLEGGIDGAGQVIYKNHGTKVIQGANTYSGETSICCDAIIGIGNDSAFGTGAVGVVNGSNQFFAYGGNRDISNHIKITENYEFIYEDASVHVITDGKDNNNYNLTLSGLISGTGSLTANSNTTLSLYHTNDYSGGTTIHAGTVAVGASGALGSGQVTVYNTPTLRSEDTALVIDNNFKIETGLTFDCETAMSLGGIISDFSSETPEQLGSITKTGAGSLFLQQANTYRGGTTLEEGTIYLANDESLSEGDIAVTGDGTLVANQAEVTLSNNIAISEDKNLTIAGHNHMIFEGQVTGDGGIIKDGDGVLTLNCDSSFTGGTTVNGGTIDLNCCMACTELTIGQDACLCGSVSLGCLINRGTITPGHSIGTITVVNNLSMQSTSVNDIEIQSNAGPGVGNDFIDVGGTASIDGTLNVIGINGYVPSQGNTITILEADGGVSGEYSQLNDNFGAFNTQVNYNANTVVVRFIAANFADLITQRNLHPAASAFQRIRDNSPTGDMATVISELESLSDNALMVAFEEVIPNYIVPQAEATFKGIDVQNNNFNGRLNELRTGIPKLWSNNLNVDKPEGNDAADEDKQIQLTMQAIADQEVLQQQQETFRFGGAKQGIWGAWISGHGTFGDFDAADSQAGFEFNTGGVTLGFDYRLLETLAAGAFVGYSNTGTSFDNGQGTSSFNSINTGMYMTWFNEEGFYASGLFGGGVNFYENNRRIAFGAIDRVAESDTTGFYLQTLATGGYQFDFGKWGIGPQLALQWVNLQIGSHRESGAEDLNLNVGAFNGNSFVTRLGFRATYEYDTPKMLLVPEVVGFWEHEYLDPISEVAVEVPGGPDSFSYNGIGVGRDSGLVGVNLVGISHTQPISFTLQYNAEFIPNNFVVNNVYAGIRISF